MALWPLLALTACTTTLEHEKLANAGAQPSKPGFRYYLPRQRFNVTAVYELKSCPDINGDTADKARPLELSQTASITESPIADPAELYSIPIDALTSGWKTTSLTGTVYENQTIHTFGATVEDKTGPILKSTLGAALSVARMTIGAPAGPPASLCKPEVYKALTVVRDGKVKLLDATLDDKARANLTAAVAYARGSLQVTRTFVFDPAAATYELTSPKDASVPSTWFLNPQLIATAPASEQAQYANTLKTNIRLKDAPPSVSPLPEVLKGQGVIYRTPAPVVVQVCAGSCADAAPVVLASLESQAAQFGTYSAIPLKNPPFEKNNLSLSFAANGRLESFTYGVESRLEKAAASLSDSATAIEGYAAKKRAVDEAEAGAELKAIKAETDLLKAKGDKIEAETRLNKLNSP